MVLTRLRDRSVFAGLCGAAVISADDVGYGVIIGQQHGPLDSRTIFIACLLAVTSVAVLAGTIVRGSNAGLWLLSAGATICLGLGFLGIFSIGLPLLVASGLIAVCAQRAGASRRPWMTLSAIGTGIVILGIGFGATQLDNLPH